MSQPPLPSDSSGTASKEGRFCFRPLSERRCRPGNLVGSCSGGGLCPPRGWGAPPCPTPPQILLPPPTSSPFLPGCRRFLLRSWALGFFVTTRLSPRVPPPPP